MLEDAKGRLRAEILDRLDAAKKQNDHNSVLRFTRLYAPLGLQVHKLSPMMSINMIASPRSPLVNTHSLCQGDSSLCIGRML